jgi:hypothetical protein
MRLALFLALFAGGAAAQPSVSGCPVFPANNIWNAAVDHLPVHPNSAAWVSSMGADKGLRLDDTIPLNIAAKPPLIQVTGITTPESDPNPYAIPANAVTEPGSDSHLVVLDTSDCILYELYAARGTDGTWTAGSGAKWDLNSNALRPFVWTSADAAGLPIFPGVVRYAELASGAIHHAVRMSAPKTLYATPTWPARHYAAPPANTAPSLPMMGQRFRLKAGFDISSYPPRLRVILTTLQRYGAMIADNGLPWAMEHDQDPRWDANELVTLHQILGSNLEAVDVASLMGDSNSAIAGAGAGLIMATDALGRPNAVKLGPGLSIVNGALVLSTH